MNFSHIRNRHFLWQCLIVLVIFYLGLILGAIQDYIGERKVYDLLQKTFELCSIGATHNVKDEELNVQEWITNLSTPVWRKIKFAKYKAVKQRIIQPPEPNLKIFKMTTALTLTIALTLKAIQVKLNKTTLLTSSNGIQTTKANQKGFTLTTAVYHNTKRANFSIRPRISKNAIIPGKTTKRPDPNAIRCKEVRRRVSQGVVDYIRNYGDAELQVLIKPLFKKKKLVVWSVDHHIGPISDLRSLFEPLGVEFLEHTLYPRCDLMCTCEQRNGLPVFNPHNIIHVNPDDLERFYNLTKNDYDIKRAHAFLVSYSIAILPLYSLFNRSVIAVAALRYERTIHFDKTRWIALNALIRAMAYQKRNVIGANSLYDKEYMSYFTGIFPDYIPSFCGYTGVHYNPTRMSYLYARRPWNNLGNSWHRRLLDHFKEISANFTIEALNRHEYTEVAAHLGIIFVPYQTSVMMFFEQYTMGIPLFAPTLDFLVQLHMIHYIVYDKTLINSFRQKGSLIPPHPSMKDTYDPNNDEDIDSVRHWLSLSDYYIFPNVTHFKSIENLVEILQSMSMARLKVISQDMMKYNRQRLKLLLHYWRKRLLEIASLSSNRPE